MKRTATFFLAVLLSAASLAAATYTTRHLPAAGDPPTPLCPPDAPTCGGF